MRVENKHSFSIYREGVQLANKLERRIDKKKRRGIT
jgi:hypothetical protein